MRGRGEVKGRKRLREGGRGVGEGRTGRPTGGRDGEGRKGETVFFVEVAFFLASYKHGMSDAGTTLNEC